MSEAEFRTYQKGDFRNRQIAVLTELEKVKEQAGMLSSGEVVGGISTNPKFEKLIQLKQSGKNESKWDEDIVIK